MMSANFICLFLPPKKLRAAAPSPALGRRSGVTPGAKATRSGGAAATEPAAVRARSARRPSMSGYVSVLNVRGRLRLFAGAITGSGFKGARGGRDGDPQQEPEQTPGPEQCRVRPPAFAEEERR